MERAKGLSQLYEDMGIPKDKFLIRLPATWASIRAAEELEQQGIRTHLILVYRYQFPSLCSVLLCLDVLTCSAWAARHVVLCSKYCRSCKWNASSLLNNMTV